MAKEYFRNRCTSEGFKLSPPVGRRRLLLGRAQLATVASSSTNTRPRKPTVKRLESLNPNRSVRPSGCTPRRSRRGKASSSPTRPRPAQLPCPRGLTRTEAASAAGAVARLPTSRLVQLRLNRRGRQRGLGNAKPAPMPFRRLRPGKFGSRDATADSLWQQGRRDEAWRPLWLDGVVRAARS